MKGRSERHPAGTSGVGMSASDVRQAFPDVLVGYCAGLSEMVLNLGEKADPAAWKWVTVFAQPPTAQPELRGEKWERYVD